MTTNRNMEIEGMFPLSDQQADGGQQPPSSPSRASQKGYPGLVLVPPSDRTILRRRLLRGALVLVALIWTVWTFTTQPPASDTTLCQSEVVQPGTGNSPEECRTASSATQTDKQPSEFSLPQVASPVEASSLPTLSQPDQEQLQALPTIEQPSPTHTKSTELHPEPLIRNQDQEKPVGPRLPERPILKQESDTHLAEQGDPFAQYRLGRHFAQQDGRQAPESVSWYKKAFVGLHRMAESGNGQAMYVLGVMYAYGRGVPRDTEQARRWLARAVEQRITAAQPVLTSLGSNHTADPKSQLSAHGKR